MKKPSAASSRPPGRPRGFDRQAALERALELFWRKGYEPTSIADLTGAMGIAAPSLYAAFGDKRSLFLEAIAWYEARHGLPMATLLDQAPTAREGVEAVLRRAAASLAGPGHPAGCMVVVSAINCAATGGDGDPCDPAQATRARREATRRQLEGRIARGAAAGELPADADPRHLALFYATVLNGMSLLARDGAGSEELARVAGAAMDAWPARQQGRGSESGPEDRPSATGPSSRGPGSR